MFVPGCVLPLKLIWVSPLKSFGTALEKEEEFSEAPQLLEAFSQLEANCSRLDRPASDQLDRTALLQEALVDSSQLLRVFQEADTPDVLVSIAAFQELETGPEEKVSAAALQLLCAAALQLP
jgi:hypothetical protein